MKTEVINLKGKKVEEIELSDIVFGAKLNEGLVHQSLTWILASRRQGTHSALTRSEVSGGGKKPWKQKGTGRARAGSIRSPLWRHGGVIFPPKPRSHSTDMPKKMRKAAISNVLSDKAREGKLMIVEEISVAKPKTSEFIKILSGLKLGEQKVLVADIAPEKNAILAARNIKDVKLVAVTAVNVFDLLNADVVVMTKAAAIRLGEVLV